MPRKEIRPNDFRRNAIRNRTVFFLIWARRLPRINRHLSFVSRRTELAFSGKSGE